ncbi:helix-turn-helix domain-containing protein [Pedobacter sp. PLR]|uniref:helix-turn-helix domain-containing protein n=1 Tax=Pedobacter sp. PLR TaxID=2994465 RepID=UPI002247A69D|nr:helix-turn-helix domain-containing protein [Pedobacter sp. PLR]MCX2451408.1 helix-turn-helix domain-containing protein [Pedobacter sp. PLR]
MNKIPIHYLNQNNGTLNLRRFCMGEHPAPGQKIGVHRDDHYIFFLFEEGRAHLLIDFQEVTFQPNQVYYILPGQVHSRINNQQANGWFLAVDAQLLPIELRSAFEENLFLQQALTLSPESFSQSLALLQIIQKRNSSSVNRSLEQEVIRTLLHSFVGIIACEYNRQDSLSLKITGRNKLCRQFKSLLNTYFKELKSPSTYAELLNVTENYLNDTIKKETGFTISYWIRTELLLESKRLLYYTSMDVKEIAHSLGFADHTYFFKIFKKHVGISPLTFRNKNRE